MTPADERRPAASDDPDRRRAEEGAREIPSVIPQPVSPPIRSESKSPQAGTQVPTQGETWVETIKTVAYALLIALIIRTFFFQPFNIPSGSMENTLLIGDYLFVEKFAYGYSRYSFPFGLPPFPGRILGSQPHRGDVVVFKYPPDPSTDYIKRVIGLPGDHLASKGNTIYVNGTALKENWPHNEPLGQAIGKVTVPKGRYFMMGDNHSDSCDSRMWVTVPRSDIIGKAFVRIWPLSRIGFL
ncbi:MAG TPA: signal peptidase I [Rhizomicrobium sp.]